MLYLMPHTETVPASERHVREDDQSRRKKGWQSSAFHIARIARIIYGLRKRRFPTSVSKIEQFRLAERCGSSFEKVEFLGTPFLPTGKRRRY
jgi:hypothetical protein